MIIAAAVKVNGHIYQGRRHGEAIHNAALGGEETPITSEMQGFVAIIDGEEIYLNRKLSRQEAVESGQIEFAEGKEGKPLISEELW